MERKDRQTLKSYFKKGTVPTEDHFASLIDSVPNIVDDKLPVHTDDGRAYFPDKDGKLEFTLHAGQGKPASWKVRLTDDGKLALENGHGETAVELGQDKRIALPGWNPAGTPSNAAPQEEGYKEYPADKQWHDVLTVTEKEFRVYDLTLVLYDSNHGHCSETRATELCLGPADCHLCSSRKHWWGWTGSMKLRLHTHGGTVYLQARSKRPRVFGAIYCKVTKSVKQE